MVSNDITAQQPVALLTRASARPRRRCCIAFGPDLPGAAPLRPDGGIASPCKWLVSRTDVAVRARNNPESPVQRSILQGGSPFQGIKGMNRYPLSLQRNGTCSAGATHQLGPAGGSLRPSASCALKSPRLFLSRCSCRLLSALLGQFISKGPVIEEKPSTQPQYTV